VPADAVRVALRIVLKPEAGGSRGRQVGLLRWTEREDGPGRPCGASASGATPRRSSCRADPSRTRSRRVAGGACEAPAPRRPRRSASGPHADGNRAAAAARAGADGSTTSCSGRRRRTRGNLLTACVDCHALVHAVCLAFEPDGSGGVRPDATGGRSRTGAYVPRDVLLRWPPRGRGGIPPPPAGPAARLADALPEVVDGAWCEARGPLRFRAEGHRNSCRDAATGGRGGEVEVASARPVPFDEAFAGLAACGRSALRRRWREPGAAPSRTRSSRSFGHGKTRWRGGWLRRSGRARGGERPLLVTAGAGARAGGAPGGDSCSDEVHRPAGGPRDAVRGDGDGSSRSVHRASARAVRPGLPPFTLVRRRPRRGPAGPRSGGVRDPEHWARTRSGNLGPVVGADAEAGLRARGGGAERLARARGDPRSAGRSSTALRGREGDEGVDQRSWTPRRAWATPGGLDRSSGATWKCCGRPRRSPWRGWPGSWGERETVSADRALAGLPGLVRVTARGRGPHLAPAAGGVGGYDRAGGRRASPRRSELTRGRPAERRGRPRPCRSSPTRGR